MKLENLPVEILFEIFLYQDFVFLLKLMIVCRLFSDLIKTEYFWELKYPKNKFNDVLNRFKLSNKIIQSLKNPYVVEHQYYDSVTVTITSNNDIVFGYYRDENKQYDDYGYNPMNNWLIFDKSSTIKEMNHPYGWCSFEGEYYNYGYEQYSGNIYTGLNYIHEIVTDSNQPILIDKTVRNRITLRKFDDEVISKISLTNAQFCIKKDNNFVLIIQKTLSGVSTSVHDISNDTKILSKEYFGDILLRKNKLFGEIMTNIVDKNNIRFIYPFVIYVHGSKLSQQIILLNLETDNKKIIFEDKEAIIYMCKQIYDGNLFFYSSSNKHVLYHYNINMLEYIHLYHLDTNISNFDINKNKLAVCTDKRLLIFDL